MLCREGGNPSEDRLQVTKTQRILWHRSLGGKKRLNSSSDGPTAHCCRTVKPLETSAPRRCRLQAAFPLDRAWGQGQWSFGEMKLAQGRGKAALLPRVTSTVGFPFKHASKSKGDNRDVKAPALLVDTAAVTVSHDTHGCPHPPRFLFLFPNFP